MKDDLQRLKWQSINKTNQESKYLQFCRTKAYYVVQYMFLTEAVLLTLLLYKTPSGYCTSFASQVRVTTESFQPKFKVFIQNFFVSFILWAMPCFEDNALFWGQCLVLRAMPCFEGNALFWGQCPVLRAMPCFTGNALQACFLVCNTSLHRMQIYKQYCPCSFLHNSSRSVSCTQDLS